MSDVQTQSHDAWSSTAHVEVQAALLDTDGVIVAVNPGWRSFATANGGRADSCGVGRSYLRVCEEAGDDGSARLADAIWQALRGDLVAPRSVVLPCHAPHHERWFTVFVSSRVDASMRCVGAAVVWEPLPPAESDVPDETELAHSSHRVARATALLSQQLLSGDLLDPVALVLARVQVEVDADLVVLRVPTVGDDTTMTVRAVVGDVAGELVDEVFPRAGSVCDEVCRTRRPRRLGLAGRPPQTGASTPPSDAEAAGARMVVPFLPPDEVLGVLDVLRREGRPDFTADDLEVLTSFARFAGLALELSHARGHREQLRLLTEHERIAADLHHTAVRAIFTATASLQSTLAVVSSHRVRGRVEEAIEELDRAVRGIRESVFAHGPRRHDGLPPDGGSTQSPSGNLTP